jgi:hypothetical protein
MKNIFIELTDVDDAKILINILHIAWIESGKNGSSIKSNWVNFSLPKKVKESYDEIKTLIASANLQ